MNTIGVIPSSSSENAAALEAWDQVGIRDLLDLKGSEEELSEFEEQFEDAVYQDVIEVLMLEEVPESEMESVADLFDADYPNDEALQDAVVSKLKQLIPDVEDRLLMRIREAKGEAFLARLAGLREHHQSKPENLKLLDEAQALEQKGNFSEAVKKLRSLK